MFGFYFLKFGVFGFYILKFQNFGGVKSKYFQILRGKIKILKHHDAKYKYSKILDRFYST